MENNKKKNITHQQWDDNYNECKNECLNNFKNWISVKPNNKGFSGNYISWTKVWNWLKLNYPDFNFNVETIGDNYVCGSLNINGEKMGSTVLTLTTFKNGEKETPEQVINRVFVKLVAQYTGFGFHLWLEPEIHNNQTPKNTYIRKPEFGRR